MNSSELFLILAIVNRLINFSEISSPDISIEDIVCELYRTENTDNKDQYRLIISYIVEKVIKNDSFFSPNELIPEFSYM